MPSHTTKELKCILCPETDEIPDPKNFTKLKSVCNKHYKEYRTNLQRGQPLIKPYKCTYSNCTETNPDKFYVNDKSTCKKCYSIRRKERNGIIDAYYKNNSNEQDNNEDGNNNSDENYEEEKTSNSQDNEITVKPKRIIVIRRSPDG